MLSFLMGLFKGDYIVFLLSFFMEYVVSIIGRLKLLSNDVLFIEFPVFSIPDFWIWKTTLRESGIIPSSWYKEEELSISLFLIKILESSWSSIYEYFNEVSELELGFTINTTSPLSTELVDYS